MLKKNVKVELKNSALDWYSTDEEAILEKAKQVGVLRTKNEDIRSLRELLTYGLKGMSAYYHHAYVLGGEDSKIPAFIQEALAATLEEKTEKTRQRISNRTRTFLLSPILRT